MTAWTELSLSAIFTKKPITYEQGRAFFNNPKAIAEGSTGAPRINPRAIAPGGSRVDGTFTNASTAPTYPGIYEYDAITLSIAKTFPYLSLLRVDGDVTISNTLSLSVGDDSEFTKAQAFDILRGNNGPSGTTTCPGGASIGYGGTDTGSGTPPAGRDVTGLSRLWAKKRPFVGGRSGPTSLSHLGRGGGGLLLIIHGNLIMTGGTIDATGQTGETTSGNHAGGGGGGSIIVICTGTITGGTFKAEGGVGSGGGGTASGGGGGGYVALVASAYAGTQTISVAGGVGNGSATDGGVGYSETVTLTEPEINGLVLR